MQCRLVGCRSAGVLEGLLGQLQTPGSRSKQEKRQMRARVVARAPAHSAASALAVCCVRAARLPACCSPSQGHGQRPPQLPGQAAAAWAAPHCRPSTSRWRLSRCMLRAALVACARGARVVRQRGRARLPLPRSGALAGLARRRRRRRHVERRRRVGARHGAAGGSGGGLARGLSAFGALARALASRSSATLLLQGCQHGARLLREHSSTVGHAGHGV